MTAEHSGGGKKAPVVTAKRAGWLALNVFLPASEVSQVFRYTGRNAARLWQRIRDVTAGGRRQWFILCATEEKFSHQSVDMVGADVVDRATSPRMPSDADRRRP